MKNYEKILETKAFPVVAPGQVATKRPPDSMQNPVGFRRDDTRKSLAKTQQKKHPNN